MSTAVKILLILILIASLGLMYTTMVQYALTENWKRRWGQDTFELKKELDASNQVNANTTMRMAKAEAAVEVHQQKITTLEAALKEREGALTEKDKEISNKDLALKKRESDYNALNDSYMANQKSLELVRARNAELTHISQVARAVAFNLNVKLAEVEDDLNNAQAELTRRGQSIDELNKKIKDQDAKLALLRKNHPEVYRQLIDTKAGAKPIDGVVADVQVGPDGKQFLITLSVGKGDGVEEGQEFIVYRAGKYIARVRVDKVLNDMAACHVVADSWNRDNLKIERNDLASNHF